MIILLRHTSLTLALARLSNGSMTSCDVTTCVREVDPKQGPHVNLFSHDQDIDRISVNRMRSIKYKILAKDKNR